MTAHWLVAAICLVAAAVVVGWPQPSRQARLLTLSRPAPRSLRARLQSLSNRRAMILAVALAALTGTLLAGPVAGVVAGAYGSIAVRVVLRRRASHAVAATRIRSLDALCGIAADLRAGLPAAGTVPAGTVVADGVAPAAGTVRADGMASAAGPVSPGRAALGAGSAEPVAGPDAPAAVEDRRMARLAEAATRLAERTGAPIADLIERIEADARAMERASAAAAAHAAGARATAWLLAGLPVGGIALGYSIGVDPLAVLLHTPIGAACAVGAIALQTAGLAWADRLASAGTERPEHTPAAGPARTVDAPLPAPRSPAGRRRPRPRALPATVAAGRPGSGRDA